MYLYTCIFIENTIVSILYILLKIIEKIIKYFELDKKKIHKH